MRTLTSVRSNGSVTLGSRRLGIYLDDVYRVSEQSEGKRISTDRSFLLFLHQVGQSFGRLTLFGRTLHAEEAADYVLPADTDLVELPHYSNLRQVLEVLAATGGSLTGFWRGLSRVDTLWIFGPHPFALAFIALAALRRRRIFLGVRQDSVTVYKARLHGWHRAPALLAVRALDGAYRMLARRLPTTVQGVELAARYGGPRANLLTMTESVVRARDVVSRPAERDWSGELELLTVGRLEPEVTPVLAQPVAVARDPVVPDGRLRAIWKLDRTVAGSQMGTAEERLAKVDPFASNE